MKNKDCELVKDLLPSYIDNLTSDETNEFIEAHIKSCPECKAYLDELQKSTSTDEKEKSKKFVKFAKKNKRKMRILKSIVFLVLAVIFVNYVRNVVIYTSIVKKNEESRASTNYHYQSYMYYKDLIMFAEYYVKDNKALWTNSIVHFDDSEKNSSCIHYFDGTTMYYYDKDPLTNIKYYISHEGTFDEIYFPFKEGYEALTVNPFLASIPLKITSSKANNRDCYKLDMWLGSNGNRSILVEKNTGLWVRDLMHFNKPHQVTTNLTDVFTDYYINLNVVTDDDLKVPNVEEYKPIEEVQKEIEKAWFDYYVEQGEEIPENLQYLLEEK